jgi:putative PIN family toxin of toxin-antitoxin system
MACLPWKNCNLLQYCVQYKI